MTGRRLILLIVADLLPFVAVPVFAGVGKAAPFEVGAQDPSMTNPSAPAVTALAWKTARGIGAKRVRTIATWGEWIRDGWGPYDRLVTDARRRHWRVQIVLTGTPEYLPKLDQRLSYDHPNTRLLRWWARQWVLRYRKRIGRYSLWNEPNHPWFLASTSVRQYRRLYLAGRRGLRSVRIRRSWHPAVMWGELAPVNDLPAWLPRRTPTKCVAIHPYTRGWPWEPDSARWGGGSGLYYLPRFRRQAARIMRAPICISEIGVEASDPKQRAKFNAGKRWARRHGARQYIGWQMVRNKRAAWDTGLVDRPRALHGGAVAPDEPAPSQPPSGGYVAAMPL